MTLYECIEAMTDSHGKIRGGGLVDNIKFDLEKKQICSSKLDLTKAKEILLERGDGTRTNYTIDGLLEFEGDPYEEIERLYAQYKRSVPTSREPLSTGYFKAVCADSLSMKELTNNMPRPQARFLLEGFIVCGALSGIIKWEHDKHFFWQGQDKELLVYRDWIKDLN